MVSMAQCAITDPGASTSHFGYSQGNPRKGCSTADLYIIRKTKYEWHSSTQLYIPDDTPMKNGCPDHRISYDTHPQKLFSRMFGKYFTEFRWQSNYSIFKFHTIVYFPTVKLYNILQDNLKIRHFHIVHIPAHLSAVFPADVYTRWLLDLDEHRPSELQHVFVKKYIVFFFWERFYPWKVLPF